MNFNSSKTMKTYWNDRFLSENQIWGTQPSLTCEMAENSFQKYAVEKILVPGSGYGRNTKFFSNLGYDVLGIEISDVAYKQALTFDQKSQFTNASLLDITLEREEFDAIYCFNLLHMFIKKNREIIVNNFRKWLRSGGAIFCVVFSEKEESFGRGNFIEENTYESKLGRSTHYFTEVDLLEHFNGFKLIVTGIVMEEENHGKRGLHTHRLRYILSKKEFV